MHTKISLTVIEGSTRSPASTMEHVQVLLDSQPGEADVRTYRLNAEDLPLFVDARSGGTWATSPRLELLLDAMLSSDLVVLASPLHWYTLSHLMKNFVDHWSFFLRSPKVNSFRFLSSKLVFPLVVGADERGRRVNRSVFASLRLSAEYAGAFCLPGFFGLGNRTGKAHEDSLSAVTQVDLRTLCRQALQRTKDEHFLDRHPLAPGTIAVRRSFHESKLCPEILQYVADTEAELLIMNAQEEATVEVRFGECEALFYDGFVWKSLRRGEVLLFAKEFSRWFGY